MDTNKPTNRSTVYTPPDLLKVNDKDPRFTYRWIKPNDRMQFVSGQEARGWEVVRFGSKGSETNDALNGLFTQFGVTSLGSTIRIGDLLLARMPKENASERQKFYQNKSRQQMKSVTDPTRNVSDTLRKGFKGKADSWEQPGI